MPLRLDFPAELDWRDAFRFPVATPEGRKDVLIGVTLILFLWPIGWILNLGNRLNVVARLHAGQSPYFTGFRPWTFTLARGCTSAAAIAAYLSPAMAFGALAYYEHATSPAGWTVVASSAAGVLAFTFAVFTLPGCMTVYAVEGNESVLRNPVMAFRRAWSRRDVYLRAWIIALISIGLSFVGLLGLLIGFLYTSVWAWEVVGYAFTVAMYAPVDRGGKRS